MSLWKEWQLTFDVFVNSFYVPNLEHGKYAEVLRFTTTNNNWGNEGDRILAIFTKYKDDTNDDLKGLSFWGQIGDDNNYDISHVSVPQQEWISIKYKQYTNVKTGKVMRQLSSPYLSNKPKPPKLSILSLISSHLPQQTPKSI